MGKGIMRAAAQRCIGKRAMLGLRNGLAVVGMVDEVKDFTVVVKEGERTTDVDLEEVVIVQCPPQEMP